MNFSQLINRPVLLVLHLNDQKQHPTLYRATVVGADSHGIWIESEQIVAAMPGLVSRAFAPGMEKTVAQVFVPFSRIVVALTLHEDAS